MSYRGAASLQAALHTRLADVLEGIAVFDAIPPGPRPATYVQIGAEEVRDASDQTGNGAEHRLTVTVVSMATGFLAAKEIAARLTVALEDGPLVVALARVVSVRFLRAVAKRAEGGSVRRIDLSFRVRIEF